MAGKVLKFPTPPATAPAVAEVELKDSFLYNHMKQTLKAEPSWTPEMYCAFNDLDLDLTQRMVDLYKSEGKND